MRLSFTKIIETVRKVRIAREEKEWKTKSINQFRLVPDERFFGIFDRFNFTDVLIVECMLFGRLIYKLFSLRLMA